MSDGGDPQVVPTPRQAVDLGELTKTVMRRMEQHRDRWSSFGGQTGIRSLSDKPSAATLSDIEIFRGLDDGFLESISPDISIAHWYAGSMLFEQGTYLDLAVYVMDGQVEVFFPGSDDAARSQALPIFDQTRTIALDTRGLDLDLEASRPDVQTAEGGLTTLSEVPLPSVSKPTAPKAVDAARQISFLSPFDFDLQPGQALTVTYFPLKDGRAGGHFIRGTRPDGSSVDGLGGPGVHERAR